MDSGIIFALVLAVLFLGAIVSLIVYSNKQNKKHTMKTSIKPPQETRSKNRAA